MRTATITLTGLRARGTHGVLDHEKVEPQDFVVDIEMRLSTREAAATDDVAYTVSYADVADVVVEIIEGEHADLIETLADRIVRKLAQLPVDALKVTVHKPNAPIVHEFADVSVTQEWVRPRVARTYELVISIGSNLDEPEEHVRRAVAELAAVGEVVDTSSLYVTAPQLRAEQAAQPDYVNAVAKLVTPTHPSDVLTDLQHIENVHGRERTERWEARTLDLDIITARTDDGELESDSPWLTLPHPRAHERRFVLEPWLEIEPEAELGSQPVAGIVAGLPDQGVRRMGEPAGECGGADLRTGKE
ncbi:2-amino-4-hydroxy-6-hydroxymethyldihydropteridine diphosphokinase [Trueperella bialowiezensis]|uniref:Bifunctional folate synthesis protein n=1 Tax=Trueperella bialowiezensis TaxID=312285 RepID=A0A3S4WGX5_9ACTO|nr:2-amino-4-hydroxy-6-hydroxymethyldihydropteridine diphosphokinase [Trueperella bialowiezensis]VEI13656.1 2-amino-4-hydroxy-6-hydroxymethyldihydropteridinepyrophosphokinase [Trueperella bialowiezensis]